MSENLDTELIDILREHKYRDLPDVRVYMELMRALEGDTVDRNKACAAAEELNDRYGF